LLSESSGWMDALDVLAPGMIGPEGKGGGDSAKAFLNSWTFYGCCEPISGLAVLPITVVDMLDVSFDGDDTMWSWYL
jgi:hypothetical protein